MLPQNGTTIGLTKTKASVQISVDNTDDESVLIRATAWHP